MASLTSVLLAAAILHTTRHAPCAKARLTEFRTERLPILAHDLHSANIDFKALGHSAKLGPRSSFRFKNGNFYKTTKGGQRVRLVQIYAGYEVYGPTAVAELDMRGYFTGQMYGQVSRNLHRDIPNPESCVRDTKTLVDRVIRLENLHRVDPGDIDQRDGRRVILADPENPKAKIIYIVELFHTGHGYLSSPVYYIEACSNHVLFHFDKVKNATGPRHRSTDEKFNSPSRSGRNVDNPNQLIFKSERVAMNASIVCSPSVAGEGGNPNTGQINYNTVPFCLPVTESGGTCTMESTHAKVVDNENSRSRDKTSVITFPCDTGYSDPTNGAFGVANDALFFGEMSGYFFQSRYGITVLKQKPRLVVHFDRNFANTVWTGTDAYFGDGDDTIYPTTVSDLITHILANGFTENNSNLVDLLQMAGIAESFSAITSVVTRDFLSSEVRWTFGADVLKSGKGAIRYLNDPPKDGKSIKNIWKYQPLMSKFHSSGIFNFAFYKLITSEDVYMEDGYDDFFVANRDLWGRFTRFRKGACSVMQASYDNGHDFDKVQSAFSNTGIVLQFCRYDALKATLFPGETRTHILAKRTRSPIVEIDMTKWRAIGVRAHADDLSMVKIVTATDGNVKNIIAKGNNYVEFPGNYTILYVKLMSNKDKDIEVTLEVIST